MPEDVPAAPVELRMVSDPKYLCVARATIAALANRCGFSDHHAGQVALALDESLCNVINHGYDRRPDQPIHVRAWPVAEPLGIRIVVEDRARQVDPELIRPRDLDDIRPGGLGVHIIREIMDTVTYEKRKGGGMRLTMIRHVPGDPRGAARHA